MGKLLKLSLHWLLILSFGLAPASGWSLEIKTNRSYSLKTLRGKNQVQIARLGKGAIIRIPDRYRVPKTGPINIELTLNKWLTKAGQMTDAGRLTKKRSYKNTGDVAYFRTNRRTGNRRHFYYFPIDIVKPGKGSSGLTKGKNGIYKVRGIKGNNKPYIALRHMQRQGRLLKVISPASIAKVDTSGQLTHAIIEPAGGLAPQKITNLTLPKRRLQPIPKEFDAREGRQYPNAELAVEKSARNVTVDIATQSAEITKVKPVVSYKAYEEKIRKVYESDQTQSDKIDDFNRIYAKIEAEVKRSLVSAKDIKKPTFLLKQEAELVKLRDKFGKYVTKVNGDDRYRVEVTTAKPEPPSLSYEDYVKKIAVVYGDVDKKDPTNDDVDKKELTNAQKVAKFEIILAELNADIKSTKGSANKVKLSNDLKDYIIGVKKNPDYQAETTDPKTSHIIAEYKKQVRSAVIRKLKVAEEEKFKPVEANTLAGSIATNFPQKPNIINKKQKLESPRPWDPEFDKKMKDYFGVENKKLNCNWKSGMCRTLGGSQSVIKGWKSWNENFDKEMRNKFNKKNPGAVMAGDKCDWIERGTCTPKGGREYFIKGWNDWAKQVGVLPADPGAEIAAIPPPDETAGKELKIEPPINPEHAYDEIPVVREGIPLPRPRSVGIINKNDPKMIEKYGGKTTDNFSISLIGQDTEADYCLNCEKIGALSKMKNDLKKQLEEFKSGEKLSRKQRRRRKRRRIPIHAGHDQKKKDLKDILAKYDKRFKSTCGFDYSKLEEEINKQTNNRPGFASFLKRISAHESRGKCFNNGTTNKGSDVGIYQIHLSGAKIKKRCSKTTIKSASIDQLKNYKLKKNRRFKCLDNPFVNLAEARRKFEEFDDELFGKKFKRKKKYVDGVFDRYNVSDDDYTRLMLSAYNGGPEHVNRAHRDLIEFNRKHGTTLDSHKWENLRLMMFRDTLGGKKEVAHFGRNRRNRRAKHNILINVSYVELIAPRDYPTYAYIDNGDGTF